MRHYKEWMRSIIIVIYLGFAMSSSIEGSGDIDQTTAKVTPARLHLRVIRPPTPIELPVPGTLNCAADLIKPSGKKPHDVNRVRPADIKYIAALGDSITTGFLACELPEECKDAELEPSFIGNSYSMGGDGGLESHLTLPNILRHVNPSLVGFSTGRGLEVENAALNVAVPGRWSDDLPRQARELVERFDAYPAASVRDDWKLVNIFVGTNDITGMCEQNNGTSKEAYKNFLLEAVGIIQKGLPRTIVSLIGMWNLDFQWRANAIIYNNTDKCVGAHFEATAQRRIEEYREALNEIASDTSLQSRTQAVVVQRIFDGLTAPLKRPDGMYDVNFYATDAFHLSKYGHSLVAKQLWKQMLQPVGSKLTTNDEMADNDASLACPDEDCPFIRTNANTEHCVMRKKPERL